MKRDKDTARYTRDKKGRFMSNVTVDTAKTVQDFEKIIADAKAGIKRLQDNPRNFPERITAGDIFCREHERGDRVQWVWIVAEERMNSSKFALLQLTLKKDTYGTPTVWASGLDDSGVRATMNSWDPAIKYRGRDLRVALS